MVLVAGVAIQPAYATVTKVTQHVFAKGVDTTGPTWVPINLTNTFTQDDAYVYAFTDASYSQTNFTWVWYEPSGAAYYTYSDSFGCDGTSCQFYDRLAVRGTDAATKFGTWRMDLLADGELLYSDTFELVAQGASSFTPSDIRAAYDVNRLLQSGFTGKGVTVAIIGLKIGSTFYSDLKEFNRKYNLPPTNISVVQPYGQGGSNDSGVLSEITADTEWVHAMAPDANILLVLTGLHTPLDGFSYVIDHNAADIATMSFFQSYSDTGDRSAADKVQSYNDEYARAVNERITLISSSGDFGSNNTVPDGFYEGKDFWTKYLPNAYMMPQYSPFVTIVGGTALTFQRGVYNEVGWNQSGGGPSNLFPQPSWQTGPGVPRNGFRDSPDVALDASCETPYVFDWEVGISNYTSVCGTSLSAPTFAGILADIEQAYGGQLGFLNPTLYSLASSDPSVYHDITSGCSVVQVKTRPVLPGYCAHPGWDFVTGWGSVDAVKLSMHLAPSAQIISAETVTTVSSSTASSFTTSSTIPILTIQNLLSRIGVLILAAAVVIVVPLGAILALRKRRKQ
jgi:subtilase family serine protease